MKILIFNTEKQKLKDIVRERERERERDRERESEKYFEKYGKKVKVLLKTDKFVMYF